MIHQAQNKESLKTQAHHSQLTHYEEDPQKDEEEEEVEEVEISCNFACKKSKGLLATAMISIRNDEGHVTPLRCLIDPGSESSFLSERAAQALRVKRSPVKGTVTGVGDLQVKINSVAHVQVLSNQDESFKLDVKAYIMPSKLTSQLPSSKIKYDPQAWSHIEGLTLADPNFYQPGRVDMLLGVKVYARILEGKVIKGPPGSPCAQETSLGWIIFGDVEGIADTLQETIVVMHHQVDVDDMLKAFWEIDTTDTRKSLTKEEEKYEMIYKETHTRNEEGRYVVTLPFKKEEPLSPKGQTRDIAMLRLKQQEKRFERDPNLKNEYVKAIEELLKLNYIEEVPEEEVNNEAVYLPYHTVIKEDKETTKTRIVFNASSKGSNGVSLNDELLIGPHQQEDMRNVVMRWRMRRIAMISDIKKMYLQILMSPKNTDYQRILWRKNASDPVKHYRLLRVILGTASAPYLAVKTLQQVTEDEGKEYPLASKVIKEDFCMDDLMTGSDTVQEAVDVAKQITEILKKGWVTLQKWASNSTEFLNGFELSERSTHAHIDIELKDCDFWWHGPQWLKHKDIELEHPIIEETDLEMKKVKIQVNLNRNEKTEDYKTLPEKFEEYDSLPDLLKSIVYARRFLMHLKEKNTYTEKTITTQELDKTLQLCIKAGQAEYFQEDIESLKTKRRVNTKSKLRTLNSSLDANGILRVGGRLHHSELDEERKHPIILGRCHVTYLIMLQQRPKCLKRQDELEIGQIVVIKNDNLPPGKWQLGRIVDNHPGADNLTRVYSVKSGDSVIKRTITKLCLMPVATES